MHPDTNPIDDLFRKKLGNQESTPPEGVWDEVQAKVQFDKVFHNKLYSYQKKAPNRVWTAIQQTIQPQSRLFTFNSPIFRYAAAAVLLITAGVWWITQSPDESGLRLANLKPLSFAFKSQLDSKTNQINESSLAQAIPTIQAPSGNLFTLHKPASGFLKIWVNSPIPSETENITAISPMPESAIISSDSVTQESNSGIAQPFQNLILDSKVIAQNKNIVPGNSNPYIQPAEIERSNKRNQQSWTVSSLFSPDVNFVSARSLGNELSNQQGKLQYTAGVRLGYALNDRWTVQSGVQYADQGTMQIPRGEQDNYTGTASFARVGTPMEIKAQIIDIPVMVRYRILGDKLKWYVNSGVNANVTGGASSLLIGTGTELRATSKISVSLEPTIRRTVETMPNLKPNTLGIFTGVNYKFQ